MIYVCWVLKFSRHLSQRAVWCVRAWISSNNMIFLRKRKCEALSAIQREPIKGCALESKPSENYSLIASQPRRREREASDERRRMTDKYNVVCPTKLNTFSHLLLHTFVFFFCGIYFCFYFTHTISITKWNEWNNRRKIIIISAINYSFFPWFCRLSPSFRDFVGCCYFFRLSFYIYIFLFFVR